MGERDQTPIRAHQGAPRTGALPKALRNGETGMSQTSAAPAVSRGMKQVRRWPAFAVLAVSFFMTIADLAIVNVALPTIGRKLHVAESALQGGVTASALPFAGSLLSGRA